MKFDSQKHHRRSIRLKEFDYAQPGGYFVTIVTYQRDLLFGEIVDEEMALNDFGKIADECWRAIPEHFPNVELGAYAVMPNHVHGIVVINEPVGAQHAAPLLQKTRISNQVLWARLSALINPLSPASSDVSTTQQASGKGIITSISSATTKIGIESIGTSSQTRPCGRKMKKTLYIRKGTAENSKSA